jgi:hypothetical protein
VAVARFQQAGSKKAFSPIKDEVRDMLSEIVFLAAAGVASQQSLAAVVDGKNCRQIPNVSFERASASLAQVSATASVNLELTTATRNKVWSEFCIAAKQQSEKGYSFEMIDSKAGIALTEYLIRQIDPGERGRSLDTILGSALGVPGLSRPKIKSYSVLTVSGLTNIDSISVNGAIESPNRKYLISVGKTSVIGYKEGEIVCELNGDAAPNKVLNLNCGPEPHATD